MGRLVPDIFVDPGRSGYKHTDLHDAESCHLFELILNQFMVKPGLALQNCPARFWVADAWSIAGCPTPSGVGPGLAAQEAEAISLTGITTLEAASV
jgi:hypothetical protein